MPNNKYYLGGYYQENSKIHKLSPKVKLLSIFISLLSLILSNNIHNIVLINIYVLTIIAYSDIQIRIYLKYLLNYKLPIFIILLISLLVTRNIISLIYIFIKLIDILLIVIALIMTTSPLEINYGLSSLLNNRFIDTKKLIQKITLFLMMIPIMNETKIQIKTSKQIRGVEKKDLSKKARIKELVSNIEPVYRVSINKIKKLSTSMSLKNYSYSNMKTCYKLNKWKKTDTIVLVINILIFILVIVY